MRVGATNKALSEGVDAGFLLEREAVFQDVTHRIAAVSWRHRRGVHDLTTSFRSHCPACEIIGGYLLEVTRARPQYRYPLRPTGRNGTLKHLYAAPAPPGARSQAG